jgi:hypothetical protein
MVTPEWRESEVLAWTEHEGPGRGPSRGRTIWFWLAGGMAAVFAGIMSSDALCPEHRLWVLLLGGGALIAAGAAIVGLISGWAGAPLLALASALGGVGIGLIDTLHSATRGRTIALAFALVFVASAVLVWRQHRQHRWDRGVARSLHTTPAVLPVPASPSPAPAPADQRV